jgi:phenylacetate-CoA ligase
MMQGPFFTTDYYLRSKEALTIALSTAPVYDSWRPADPGEKFPIDYRYAKLSELTKNDIRDYFPSGLVPCHRDVAEGLRRGEIEFVETSGTTDERVTNIWYQPWWNASEAASWKLNRHTANLDGAHREAILASAMNVGFRSKADLSMRERTLGRFLFLNEKATVREWTDHHYRRMLDELEEYRPVVLEANPSLLARLSWWAIEKGARVYQPQVIVFTYEYVSAMHLRDIQRVFQSPVVSSYGATEVGYVFMQCEYGVFHQNTDFCRVDFKALPVVHGGPSVGRILLTTFNHPWVSLIRFDVGDLVRQYEEPSCPCGRDEGFLLSAVEGRLAYATFTTDGRLVTTRQVDEALSAIDDVRDYQLEQHSANLYVLQLVTIGDPQAATRAGRAALRELYGSDADVQIELCADIEPTVSGKYRRTHASIELDIKRLLI